MVNSCEIDNKLVFQYQMGEGPTRNFVLSLRQDKVQVKGIRKLVQGLA